MDKINATDIITTCSIDSDNITIEVADGVEVTVRSLISLQDSLEFVKSVVDNCFEEDTNAYLPEIKDFAIRCAICEFYTNIDLPGDTEKAYEFVYSCAGLLDAIVSKINQAQFGSMMNAINDKIDSIVSANINFTNSKLIDMYTEVEGLTSKFEELFSQISPSDISGFVSAVSNGTIDEKKLVSAYMHQKKGK